MSCNCGTTGPINSWYDLQNTQPRSPLDLIADASFAGQTGVFTYSDTFVNPPGGVWADTPITLASSPICIALRTDDRQKVEDAEQWNFQHLSGNTATDLAPPMRKLLYLKGGTQWSMRIMLTFAEDFDELELSFRDNAGTRGDYAGAIPVIKFDQTHGAGSYPLIVTLKDYGHVSMGLKTITVANSDWAMYESEWVIVP